MRVNQNDQMDPDDDDQRYGGQDMDEFNGLSTDGELDDGAFDDDVLEEEELEEDELEEDSTGDRQQYIILLAGIAIFALNCILFASYFDEIRQGFEDSERGINEYFDILSNLGIVKSLGYQQFGELRLAQLAITGIAAIALWFTGFLSVRSLALFLIWPYSAYLGVKIRKEFIFFPFAFARLRTTFREEVIFTAVLLAITVALSENNGLILIGFRWLNFFLVRPFKLTRVVLITGMIGLSILVDRGFTLVSRFVPEFQRYTWTRDIVNPEYSIIESFGVLAASFHLGITPPKDWWFHIPFTFIVLGIAALGLPKLNQLERKEFFWSVISFLLTYLFFTSLTHAFQNARYYYFLIPIVFIRYSRLQFLLLALLSLAHVIFAVVVYEAVYR